MRVRWGILSTANIGVKRVIAALQKSEKGEVTAIASRSLTKAKSVAERLAIPKAYGSYEALIQDVDVDAIYNPLPNHLHLPWTLAALQAGKHVLIEKPITCNAVEAEQLVQASRQYPHLKVAEAFMYRYHPQWSRVRTLIADGVIGNLRSIHSWFSYCNTKMDDYRYHPEMGGGGLLDVGCYCTSVSRLLFDSEPQRLTGIIDLDPQQQVDRYASAILQFANGVASFTCATQMAFGQQVSIYGDRAAILIEAPFIPSLQSDARLWLLTEEGREEILIPPLDHFILQADAFNRAVLEESPLAWTVEDGWRNMRVLDAVRQSAQLGRWIDLKAAC